MQIFSGTPAFKRAQLSLLNVPILWFTFQRWRKQGVLTGDGAQVPEAGPLVGVFQIHPQLFSPMKERPGARIPRKMYRNHLHTKHFIPHYYIFCLISLFYVVFLFLVNSFPASRPIRRVDKLDPFPRQGSVHSFIQQTPAKLWHVRCPAGWWLF